MFYIEDVNGASREKFRMDFKGKLPLKALFGFRLLDSIKMSNSMNNQRQPAGFAISDILELDRQNNPHSELDPSITDSLYTTTDLSYMPRHWGQLPDHGKFNY